MKPLMFLLLPTLFSGSVRAATPPLITDCLAIQSKITNMFTGGEGKLSEGQVSDFNDVNFYFKNFKSGFKAICSNAKFTIDKDSLKSSLENQDFVFLWSTNLNIPTSDQSGVNIEYSLEKPKDIKTWLQEKM